MAEPTMSPGFSRETKNTDCWNRIGVRGDRSCPKLVDYVHCRNCPVQQRAASQLFDSELPAGYADEWARHYAAPATDELAASHAVVLFRLGAEWLALPASTVAEIATLRAIHSVPHRREGAVLGVVSVRGELVVCVSLARVLGVGAAESEKPAGHRRLMVMAEDSARIACPVDEVHGIYRHDPRDLREVPATLAHGAGVHLAHVLSWRDRTVGVIDEARLFATLNRSLA